MRKITVVVGIVGILVAGPIHAQTTQEQIGALMAQVAALQAQLATLLFQQGIQSTPVPVSAVHSTSSYQSEASSGGGICFSGVRNLFRGLNGEDVYSLQDYLKNTGDYDGEVTGYFGPLTEAAVQRWQSRNGVVTEGTPETTGFGVVGPKTRTTMLARCGIRSSEIPTTRACFVDGAEVLSGQSTTLYKQEVVAAGQSACTQLAQVRSCNNGVLSGDAAYQYRECKNGEVGSCVAANTVIPNNSSIQLYSKEAVSVGGSCAAYVQTRTCTNGVLSGDSAYVYASCTTDTTADSTDDINALLDALVPKKTNTPVYDFSSLTTFLNTVQTTTSGASSSSSSGTNTYQPYIPVYTEANTRGACTYGSSVYPEGTRTEGKSQTQLCLGATLSLCSVNVQTLTQYTCRSGVWEDSGLPTIDTSTTQYNTCSPGSSNDCHFCPLAGYGYWTTAVCAQ